MMGSRFKPGTSILLVEDDPATRGAIKMVLEWEGYRVECAANGREALGRLTAGERPALLLLDLNMPVMDGRQLREEMQRDPALASIPVVTVSAARDAGAVEGAGCVHKPFEPAELLEAIQWAVRTG
jgi:CheY-like chemotaxis protein